MDTRNAHPTDLTGPQWAQVSRFIPAPKPGGRPATYERREIVNPLLYLVRTGCQGRAMPHDLPPWRITYWFFTHVEEGRRCRRLSKDDEVLPETGEAMIKLAMIHLMVRGLTKKPAS